MNGSDAGPSRARIWSLYGIGVAIGVLVGLATRDVVLGVIAGAGFIAISVGLVRLWTGGGSSSRPRYP